VTLFELNPLQDSRWPALVDRHPNASVFHSVGWLDALRRTYGYQPVAYTTTPPGRELTDGFVFCRVHSWLSGSRLVSLPFSDHCDPLADSPESLLQLMQHLQAEQRRRRWKYIELRPLSPAYTASVRQEFLSGGSFSLQVLDLRPDLETLYQHFHKSCVQRKIQRAQREKLTYEEGQSEALLRKFYSLLILTRRKHGVPPQPLAWFRNVLTCLKNKAVIRLASKDGQPVASILTISFRNAMVYKYGCSDPRFNNLGGTALLFWEAIQDAKHQPAAKFDFGRSDLDNPGLIAFKENWGALSVPLNYIRVTAEPCPRPHSGWADRMAKYLFAKMPSSLLTATGKLLYRHIG
jgi:hypothetical protein